MAPPILEFNDLTLGYSDHAAVHHFTCAVERGASIAVLGANGSGKSTLLKGIAGLVKPMAGGVKIASVRLTYLPQQSELDRSFPARVQDLVALGLWQTRGLFGRRTAEDRARIATAIKAVGLAGFETRPIDTLSGGQMQRALFARVMLQNADLILLDEPFSAVDQRTLDHLLAMIAGWTAQGRTVLTVLHDYDLAQRHFPQTMLMARKLIAYGPTTTVLTSANLDRARGFDEAWSDDAPWCEADAPASGHAHADHARKNDNSDHSHKHAAE